MLRDHELRVLLGRDLRPPPPQALGPRARVLVSGGAGSIGSALVRRIADLGGRPLGVFDRDRAGLERMSGPFATFFEGRIEDPPPEVFRRRWDVVVNAAALKDVCPLEGHPERAYRVNALAALRLARIAARNGAGLFLQLSTDKAADPAGVMGASKRAAELLLLHEEELRPLRVVCLRLPNILGSSRSIVPKLRDLLERGAALPLRDLESTRFYLGLKEATDLLLHAMGFPTGLYAAALDLEGTSLRDLAARAVSLWGRDPEIHLGSGALGPGEKLHETLVGDDETPRALPHGVAELSSSRDPQEELDALRRRFGFGAGS